MKIRILHILIICLMTLFMSAQECEYGAYFQIVDSAKQDFKKQDFKKANEKFKLAFSKTDFPLGHDLSFALISAIKSKDDKWASTIAEKLAKGGVPLRYFGNHKKEKWYKKFSSEFENYATYSRDSLNLAFRDKIISLLEKDRGFNEKYHQWRTHEIEMTLEELVRGAYEILDEFNYLTVQYGFPTEKKIGYNYLRRKNAVESFPIAVLMVHIYQRGVPLFESEIPKIVCEGGLHPQWFETLKKIHGFGNGIGIEQEMKARYEKFRGPE